MMIRISKTYRTPNRTLAFLMTMPPHTMNLGNPIGRGNRLRMCAKSKEVKAIPDEASGPSPRPWPPSSTLTDSLKHLDPYTYADAIRRGWKSLVDDEWNAIAM